MRNHLFQSLHSTLARYPNSGIILLGDFNKFNPGSLISSFDLKQIVKEPTRGANILDKIYTSISTYYDDVKILPPIGQSDHSSVFVQSLQNKVVHINSLPTLLEELPNLLINCQWLIGLIFIAWTLRLTSLLTSCIRYRYQWISIYLFAKPRTILVISHG